MKLALFDLDHTLLDIDSDYSWGEFIVRRGLVDEAAYREKNARFYQDYIEGKLDPVAYNEFVFEVFTRVPQSVLYATRQDFMDSVIRPAIRSQALAALQEHRACQHQLVMITATNSFITAPVARLLDIPTLIATEPETDAGGFTGRVASIPCFQGGKLVRLRQWLASQPPVTESWAYSDSFNDLPLLEFVSHPAAVTPDARLAAVAAERGWPVLDWAHAR